MSSPCLLSGGEMRLSLFSFKLEQERIKYTAGLVSDEKLEAVVRLNRGALAEVQRMMQELQANDIGS